MTEQSDSVCHIMTELKALGVTLPKKLKRSIPKQTGPVSATSLPSTKVFGVGIGDQEKVCFQDELLPKFIVTSTSYLKKFTQKEGLFRLAGSVSRQKDLRMKVEQGESINESEPNDVASLLKQWLRELPEPLIPSYLQDLFVRCQNLQVEDKKVSALLLCCHLLPSDHFVTLKHLLQFLSYIADHCDKNKMDACNLALVMAPNIFVMRNDPIDKSSSTLVQQHTSVIELLINNVHKVGALSLCSSSSHLEVPDALKSEAEFNLSIDAVDNSPSKPKKKRSGHVQDLFTGMRKLVGQNSVSPNPPKKSHERCASKRKHDPEMLTPLKKHAAAANGLHGDTPTFTPNGKKTLSIFGSKEKSGRRKSFGLFKKKQKRQKSSKSTVVVETNLSVDTPDPFDEKLAVSVSKQEPASFIKKSASECYLTGQNNALRTIEGFSATSEGCLLHPINNLVPYNLRSKSSSDKEASKRKSDDMKNKETAELEMNSSLNMKGKCVSDVNLRSEVKDVNDGLLSTTLKQSDVMSSTASCLQVEEKVKRNCSLSRREAFIIKPRNSRKNSHSKLKRADSIKISRSKLSRVNTQNNLDSKINKNLDSNSSRNINSNSSDVKNISANDPECNPKTGESLPEIIVSNISKSENAVPTNVLKSVSSVIADGKAALTDASDKRRIKRNIRNGSIVRGRPNTVRTGLRSDICSRYNGDSMALHTKHQAAVSTSSVDNDLFIHAMNYCEKTNNDSSLTTQLQNITLCSPKEGIARTSSESNKEILGCILEAAVSDAVETKAVIDVQTAITVTDTAKETITDSTDANSLCFKESKPVRDLRMASKRKSRERICSNSDSKIHHAMKKPSKVSRINSFPEPSANSKPRKERKSIAVKSSSPKKTEKETATTEIGKENMFLKESESQSHLSNETPTRNAPSPETWVSGRKVFDSENASRMASKRKSRERICSNSDSKIHHAMKKPSKVSRINSFPEPSANSKPRKERKLIAVKSSSPKKTEKETATTEIGKENMFLKESESQSHLSNATPTRNAPSPETWVSGRKVFDSENASRMASKRKSRERICSNSDSKIHHAMKKPSKVSRINSFLEPSANSKPRKERKLIAVKSSSPKKTTEKETATTEIGKENMFLKESESQSHLSNATPTRNAPSPETWVSGRKVFDSENASPDDIMNKRESIAMILKNKSGHVRATASIFNCRTQTVSNSSPSGGFYDSQLSSRLSSQKKNTSVHRNSPLPPPPKFVIPDSPLITSYPLKELTNRSSNEDTPFTPSPSKCTLKPKMNSYSGHTPYKVPANRRVLRSESSR